MRSDGEGSKRMNCGGGGRSIWMCKMVPNSGSCFSGDQWFSLKSFFWDLVAVIQHLPAF